MDITAEIARMKKEPGFARNVGMILTHNGIVRAWSRSDRKEVTGMEVHPNRDRIEALRTEYEARPGIWRVVVEASTGRLKPGDDLLFIVVAGDIRENVKPVLAELLDRIKAEAVTKSETKI